MTMAPATDEMPTLPLSFRREEASKVMQCVRATDSCALIGVSSTGKGNLLRFLARGDVIKHYLGDEAVRTLLIYVDCNKLREVSDIDVYELCLREMLEALENRTIDIGMAEARIAELHRQVLRANKPIEAQVAFEQAVKLLSREHNLKLVFELDEFDLLVEHLDHRSFLALRALRDDRKQHLCYVVTMRQDPIMIADDVWREAESFFELFTTNMFTLPPYNYEDAEFMLRRLASRYDVSLTRKAVRQIIEVTGGHAGFIAVAFRLAQGEDRLADEGFFGPLLLEETLIVDECDKIWDSLDRDERKILAQIATGQEPDWSQEVGVIADLEAKGMLVQGRDDEHQIFSVLLEVYSREKFRRGPASNERYFERAG